MLALRGDSVFMALRGFQVFLRISVLIYSVTVFRFKPVTLTLRKKAGKFGNPLFFRFVTGWPYPISESQFPLIPLRAGGSNPYTEKFPYTGLSRKIRVPKFLLRNFRVLVTSRTGNSPSDFIYENSRIRRPLSVRCTERGPRIIFYC